LILGEGESLAREPLLDTDPAQIGRYRLTDRIGAGGMGVVYLGQARDGSLVAVKVLRPELTDDPEFRNRFGREVANLTRIKGVCTVRVIEADTGSARPFMVTEYVPGPSLSEYVAKYGPPGPDMMYGLATGLAEALTAIHAAGVVHRDLKPSNVILGQDGPKVIDFGIAQALDATSVTRTGMMVGSPGFMAPEQLTGRPGQPADVFAWAVTLAYAASGEMPFGTGSAEAIFYRILHVEPDTAPIPERLRQLVEAALAKDPQRRPRADELLARLTSRTRTDRDYEFGTQAVLAQTWPATEAIPVMRPTTGGSLLLEPGPAATSRHRRGRVSRRAVAIGGPVLAVIAAVLVLALTTGHFPGLGHLTANQQQNMTVAATALGPYLGQEQRGVSQTVDRVVASGNTIVTMGSQTSDGVVRQQFFVSTNGGATWRLASLHASGGGPAPLGHMASRLAGGPGGWVAVGPQAIWTSPDGVTWTLAATHGITPQLPGDQFLVITSTAQGFLAAGEAALSGGGTQAVIWTSRDGLTWQRKTGEQLGLTALGSTAQGIVYATARGDDTVISGGGTSSGGTNVSAAWLSTDGGSTWTAVTIPVDHGADSSMVGLGFDGSGLIAVRSGVAAAGGPDGVAYFSPTGQTWQYAGTIDPDGGWRPNVVKGRTNGFVVTGTTSAGQIVAYTSTGTGGTWQPTGSLGQAATENVESATVGSGGTVIAVGNASGGGRVSQQAVFLAASPTGTVRPVSTAAIAGGLVPELAVNGLAAAGGAQIAVGSADGYPAVWRQASGRNPWSLVSSLPVVSAYPGLSALTSVTHGSAGWLAVGGPGPVMLTSTDGTTWQRASGSIAQDLGGASAVVTAANPSGYVVAGNLGASGSSGTAELWWSANLTSWTRVTSMNDTNGAGQVLAIGADAHEFVAVGSDGGHPAVWTTTDGKDWTTIVLGLPSGASAAVLQQVAINGDHVVALGQATKAAQSVPFAELSANGGASWQEAPFGSAGPGTAVTALTAGSGGFTAASQSGAPGQQDAQIWTSATGSAWTPAQVSGLSGGGAHEIAALISSGSAVTGIGLTATQQSQQPVVVSAAAG
jgi:Protein kinase domain